MDVNYQAQYALFNSKRKAMADMLGQSAKVIEQLNMTHYGKNLADLGNKVDNDTLKIQIVGTFKNGKSTFINSLLGEDVLPAASWPCTAVINEVKFGDRKKAVLHFRNPLPENLPSSIPAEALAHIGIYKGQEIPPIEIPYEEINKYVTIPMDCDNPQDMLLETPYEKVELFWPLELLKNGVEIIDSPGLNEAETRTKVTVDYLTKADAIIMVMDATKPCAKSEMDFIENTLQNQGFTDPFFVVNRWDLISARESDMMAKFIKTKIGKFSTNDIFFVSALNGLDGKLEQDEAKYEASGVKALETRLSDFLTKEKGKIKLAQPARELKRILTNEALFKVIPTQRQLLSTSLEEVKAQYDAIQPQLGSLKTRKEQLLNKMLLRIEQSKHEFRRAATQNLTSLCDQIPAWVEEYQPVTKLGLIPSKEKIQTMVNEIAEHVKDKIDDNQKKWQTDVLQPLIEEKSSTILESVETDVQEILKDIDSINVEVSGQDATPKEVPMWERIAGAAGGLIAGGWSGAITGGTTGFSKELAKNLGVQFAGFFLLGLLGMLNPITGIMVMVGGMLVGSPSGKLVKNIKKTLVEKATTHISETAEQSTDALADKISEHFTELANTVSNGLDVEINETENQLKGIIAEMEKGKENVAERTKVIDECEASIKQLDDQLNAFIFELVG